MFWLELLGRACFGAVLGFGLGICLLLYIGITAVAEEPAGANDFLVALVMGGVFIVLPVCTAGGFFLGGLMYLILGDS